MGCSKNYIMYWGGYVYYNSITQKKSVHKDKKLFKEFVVILANLPRRLLDEQCLKLLLADFLLFNQQVCAGVKYGKVLSNYLLGLLIALVNDPFYFLVDGGRHALPISPGGVGEIPANEDLVTVVVIIDQTHRF